MRRQTIDHRKPVNPMNVPFSLAPHRFLMLGFLVLLSGFGYGQVDLAGGSKFATLRPEQKQLLMQYALQYSKITKRKLNAQSTYDGLPLSYRTTYDAITHALLTTKLTDQNARPIGNALDLVDVLEGIHGQSPGLRGDHQFRIYLALKKDAVDKLYASREFRRKGDNSIYHLGYPVNFRLTGGDPSIQISVTRTGRRADIDVDYRSSRGPQALFNGHLTAANSDVRAGGNYDKHAERWSGFEAWWRQLLSSLSGIFPPSASGTAPFLAKIEIPSNLEPKTVEEAAHLYFDQWLVQGKPESVLSLFSVKSFPCIAEYGDDSQPDSTLARLRIWRHMQLVKESVGEVSRLEDILQSVALYAPGAKPVRHPYEKAFAVEQLPEDVAYDMDCRLRLNLPLIEQIPRPKRSYGETYGVITRLRRGNVDDGIIVQVWKKEEGHWRIVSRHLEHPFGQPVAPAPPRISTNQPKPLPRPEIDPDLARAAEDFLQSWFVKGDTANAVNYVGKEAHGCRLDTESSGDFTFEDLQKRMSEIARTAGKSNRLEDVISSVEHGHTGMQECPHPSERAFLLARVSDELGEMFDCALTNGPVARNATEGTPQFSKGLYVTSFRMKAAGDAGAAIVALWQKKDGAWRIRSYQLAAD